MDVQARSESTGIRLFPTVKEAFDYADTDLTVWKISFSVEDERIRMIRTICTHNSWAYEPIL